MLFYVGHRKENVLVAFSGHNRDITCLLLLCSLSVVVVVVARWHMSVVGTCCSLDLVAKVNTLKTTPNVSATNVTRIPLAPSSNRSLRTTT